MKNLAGVDSANLELLLELYRCGVDTVFESIPEKSEVPYHYLGWLNGFTFRRNWSYWVVEGYVPMDAAWKMWIDPIGRKWVRVDGYAGNKIPEPRIWLDNNNNKLMSKYDYEKLKYECGESECLLNLISSKIDNKYKIVRNVEFYGIPYIDLYHIDREAGLKLFVEIIKNLKVPFMNNLSSQNEIHDTITLYEKLQEEWIK